MSEPTKPTKDDKGKEQAPKRKRPSREEEIAYFQKAAKDDLTVNELFAKRNLMALV